MLTAPKFTTPRAFRRRETISDELAHAHDPRIVPGLPMARVALAKLNKPHGATLAESAEFLGFSATAEKIDAHERGVRQEMLERNDTVAKGAAMSAGDAESGATFLPTEIQRGFIDSLEHQVVVRQFIPEQNKILSRSGVASIPSITAGVSAEMVGENPTLGNLQAFPTGSRTLLAKKMRVEVLVSRDLIRSALNIDQILYSRMAAAAARLEDRLLVEGTGAEHQFRGLKVAAEGALAAAQGSPDYSKVRADLRSLLRAMRDNKVPDAAGRVFIGASQHRDGLEDFQGPDGVFPFGDSLDERGTLLGKPAAFSSALGTDCFYCFAPGEAIFLEQLNMDVEADTTYHDAAGVAHAAGGQDMTVFRLFRAVDFLIAHPESVEYLSDVTWGA